MKNNEKRLFRLQDVSLSLKILVPTILSIAVVISVFTFYLIDDQRARSKARLNAKAKNLTDLLAYSNIDSLWNFNVDQLQDITGSFFFYLYIVSIIIMDQREIVYADLHKETRGSEQITLTRAIKKGEEQIGTLKTVFTNYHIEKNLTWIKIEIIVLSLIIFTVIIFFIVIISKRVLKPLDCVLEGIDHVARGDYHYRIERLSNDEIGQVARQFNRMSRQITRLQDLAVKTAETGKEMEIAKNIQMSLQPSIAGFTDCGFEISANMTPAEDVGGDYYDIIRSCDKKLWFGIGDVTGHGLVSGLVMMMAQVAVNTLIRSTPDLSPQELLTYANTTVQFNIREGLKKDHHMTISFIKEEKEGEYRYAGAHEIILIYRVKTKQVEQIETKGMWMGIVPDISKPTNKFAGSFTLEPGDILFLYTDGVIEIKNRDGEQFDIERLSRFIVENAAYDTDTIKQNLLVNLNKFKANQDDDITFLIMKKE